MNVIRDWHPTAHLREVPEWHDDRIRYVIEQTWERVVDNGYGTGPEVETEWRRLPRVSLRGE